MGCEGIEWMGSEAAISTSPQSTVKKKVPPRQQYGTVLLLYYRVAITYLIHLLPG